MIIINIVEDYKLTIRDWFDFYGYKYGYIVQLFRCVGGYFNYIIMYNYLRNSIGFQGGGGGLLLLIILICGFIKIGRNEF